MLQLQPPFPKKEKKNNNNNFSKSKAIIDEDIPIIVSLQLSQTMTLHECSKNAKQN